MLHLPEAYLVESHRVASPALSQTLFQKVEDIMTIKWHKIEFKCPCGLDATILEFCVSADGGIALTGLCVRCGTQFSHEDTMPNLIAKSAVGDFVCRLENCSEDDALANFEPTGKPS